MRRKTGRTLPGFLLGLVLMLGLFAALGASAWADAPEGIRYIDRWWDESSKTVREENHTVYAKQLDGNFEGTLGENKWYYVEGDDNNYSGRLVVNGIANIILCDDAYLFVNQGIKVDAGNTLNIYAQSNGSGKLECEVAANSEDAAIGSDNEGNTGGTINVYGGIVSADSAFILFSWTAQR